ncbi:hypothetical protein IFM89_017704 [Coptis chinensis]|uniref:Myb/SANT-like domain-containing protein n=1 Tax=Coptis chinensis TaxID=261450 RepID=A0A835M0B5_9MAGN|nr:hypothetical protein IFM89_017704 [Coptis chinensis]
MENTMKRSKIVPCSLDDLLQPHVQDVARYAVSLYNHPNWRDSKSITLNLSSTTRTYTAAVLVNNRAGIGMDSVGLEEIFEEKDSDDSEESGEEEEFKLHPNSGLYRQSKDTVNHGLGLEAFEPFGRMVGDGVKPKSITILSLLSACIHSGLEGCTVFSYTARFGVKHDLNHYVLAWVHFNCLQLTRWSPMMDDILIQVLLEKALNGTGRTSRNRFDLGTLKEAAKVLNQRFNLSIEFVHVYQRIKTIKKDYNTIKQLIDTTEFGFTYNQHTKFIEADRQAWDAYFRTHPKDKHLRERMFPHFAEACAIFENDFSHHIVNVDARFGLLSFGDTSQAESVQADTQVESGERFGGHGESSGVVDDTTSSPLLVEYSFPSVEYSWQ